MSYSLKSFRKSRGVVVKKPGSWAGPETQSTTASISSNMSTRASSSWSIRTGMSGIRMRPILDFRMPTLANKSTFLLPIEDAAANSVSRLSRLETSPPSSLKDVRHTIYGEIKAVQKKLSRLERSYYGVGKSLNHEVEKYSTPIKILVRMLGYFELSSTKAIEAAIKYGSDPKRYKGDPGNVQLLKDVYTKMQSFVPGKFSEVSEVCLKMLSLMEKYCISFYEPGGEVEVETAAHYEIQIRSWKKAIHEQLENVNTMVLHFKNRGIHYTMFSSPVATFCQRSECEIVPFLLLFPEACTNIKTVLSILSQWLKADENYSVFLQNDVRDLDHQKEEHTKVMREARERYHSAVFKVNQSETEYTKLMSDLDNLKEKEEANETEETYLENKCNELELDMEFKEGRLDELRSQPIGMDIESMAITWDNLNEELRYLREELPSIKRSLSIVKQRREWMREKRAQLDKLEKEIIELTTEMKETENEKCKRESECQTIEKTAELSRRLLLLKTSNDSVEKIFYDLPVTARHAKAKLPNITTGTDGSVEKACRVVVKHIDQDWMQLYRNLPFLPKRGAETIEKDIASIAIEGSRGPKKDIISVALSRWRRHHTRARAEDLKHGLKAIKRLDVLKEVEAVLNPPPVEQEPPEYFPPGMDPALIPHYRDVIKFDKLLAAKKVQVLQLEE